MFVKIAMYILCILIHQEWLYINVYEYFMHSKVEFVHNSFSNTKTAEKGYNAKYGKMKRLRGFAF